jgi:CBS domain containing-hemolysin-like protein
MLAVPESESLRRLLGELRRDHRTFALAIDEYGGIAGLVTVEDVLEELVGEIEDEFDREDSDIRRLGVGRFLVRGTLRIHQLEELFETPLPEGEYETIAGFVLDRLGHIPEPGERVVHERLELTVMELEAVRITSIAIRELPAPTEPADGQVPS